jgi:putative ABC transport system permease protein
VSAALRERPASTRADGGVPARRAMIRWAWRLFRRDWRQQLLVLGMLAVAVAGAVLGAAVTTNTPPPANRGFGTASYLITLPGSDPHLAADLHGIGGQFGTTDVIENQQVAVPGSVQGFDLRAQNPAGPYGGPMLSLTSGRYPRGPHEVAMTASVAALLRLRVGGLWHQDGQARRVTGLVENPQNLLDGFALVAPGQVRAPGQVSVLLDGSAAAIREFSLPRGAQIQARAAQPVSSGINGAVVVLILATLGLIFIGLVSVAGFTVLSQRRLRAIGMLGALGATNRNIRLVMVANGAVVGIVATLVGAVAGFVAWIAYAPHLQTIAEHHIDVLNLPWWAIGVAMALAIVTSIAAAGRPAGEAARLPVVAALSGRPAAPRPARHSAVVGSLILAAGLVLFGLAGQSNGNGGAGSLGVVGGLVAMTVGGLFLAHLAIAVLAVAGRRTPVAVRLALRDLARYRARSGAALGAVCFAAFIAVLICIGAAGRFSDVLDLTGPNLAPNQLVVYTACNNGACLSSPPTPAQSRALQARIAAALGTRDVVALYSTSATLLQGSNGSNNFSGNVYVATPALLRHYGITQGQVNRDADILTSRNGLAAVPKLHLVYGNFFPPRGGPPPPITSCPAGSCLAHPKIQDLTRLPLYVSGPNTVITEHAVRALGLPLSSQVNWLIQTPRPLTSAQTYQAQQLAAAAGATIETKSAQLSLSQLLDGATVFGVLLAFAMLAMTVGLIRSETASDLRTLAATGAGSTTRRTITGATAGALGLLGGLLGTATAYLAGIAWYHSSLATLSNVPVANLLIIVIGMPLAAAAGGWLLAGRQPPAIARQPLD